MAAAKTDPLRSNVQKNSPGTMMRACRLTGSIQNPSLLQADVPRPAPGPGDLLIKVQAAGLISAELSWYPTWHTKTGSARVGAIPGHEFSGVVAAAGRDVGCLEVGHEVFGMNDWYSDGALAEYCIAPYFAVALKPAGLTYVEAASVPISALTAWQGLFDHAKLQKGERVLIHGGAGGVGVFAIQLARLRGAHVITTASASNREFVLSLGADQAMDYRVSRFEDLVRDLDVVFDAVGGETLERSWSVLKPSGRLVTVVSTAVESTDPRVKKAFFIVEPKQKQLEEIAVLLHGGQIRPVVDAVIPLGLAPDAYVGKVSRQGRGKLVVTLDGTSEGLPA